MAAPASGSLSMLGIKRELENDNYNHTDTYSNISLKDMSDGTDESIYTGNLNANKPDTSAPHLMSEFYKYDHRPVVSTNPGSFSIGSGTSSGNTINVFHVDYSTFWVSAKPNWVTITSGNYGSSNKQTGSGTVTFDTTANTGSQRSGSLVVSFDVGTTGGGIGDANSTTTRTSTITQSGSGGGGGGGGGPGGDE